MEFKVTKMEFHPLALALAMFISGYFFPLSTLTYFDMGFMFISWVFVYLVIDILFFIGEQIVKMVKKL